MIKIFFGVLFFIFLSRLVGAANTSDVVITEIAWMGTVDSYTNEWLELYNTTDAPINFEGWTLRSTDGTPSIALNGFIEARGFFLLERTDENTLPNYSADQIYTGALGNTGEHLELLDSEGNIIDEVNAWGSWFAGDNTTKQTMERRAPGLLGSDANSWVTSAMEGGTPGKLYEPPAPPAQEPPREEAPLTLENEMEKSSPQQSQEITNSSTTEGGRVKEGTATTTSTATPARGREYPKAVLITELMPSPRGDDGELEWIEIANNGDDAADISFWKIQDTEGATNSYEFSQNTIISPRAFLVFSRLTTKITLNNDSDGLKLIRPDGEVAASVDYKKAQEGKSYALINSTWQWTDVPTPGSANIFVEALVTHKKEDSPAKTKPIKTLPPPQKPTKITDPLPIAFSLSSTTTMALDTQDASTTTNSAALQSASLLNTEAKDTTLWPTFATGFLIAVFSTVLIFLLRRRK